MREGSFKQYDIRGKFGCVITAEYAAEVGRRFVEYTKAKRVAVGYDNRFSSPILECGLIKGLMGCEVLKLGVCSSPMLYFAVEHLGLDGGIMITASHNPLRDNGFKLLSDKFPICGQKLYEMMKLSGSNISDSEAVVYSADISLEYINSLFVNYRCKQKLRILWDTQNATIASIIGRITAMMPDHTHVCINDDMRNDVSANPMASNLHNTSRILLDRECDIGFAFDTDGDRICVIDRMGNVLSTSHVLIILLQHLRSLRGKLVIVDVKVSNKVLGVVSDIGAKYIVSPTGHSFIKAKMKKTGAILAGEGSGHIFFAENHGYDDALYAAIKLIMLLSCSCWDDLLADVPNIFLTPEVRIKVQNKNKVIERIKKYLRSRNVMFDVTDGVKVKTKNNGWWLVRCSNTEDVITFCCEGDSEDDARELYGVVKRILVAVCGVKI